MQFTEFKLDDRLQRAVKAIGYTATTPIQEAAMPAALERRDLVGTAQTGTGKTAAFVLPILQRLLTTPAQHKRTRVLIVTPTRELAEQIHAAIQELGQFTKIRSATVYGGVGMAPQIRALRNGAEIIVACPGRLIDHMERGNADLSAVETLVLDEADRMLDMGFLPPVRHIVSHIPRQRHTMLFSATFAPELGKLVTDILTNPLRIEMGIAAPADTVDHELCPVAHEKKTELLLELLEKTQTRSVLIFTRTKHRADRLARQVQHSGYRATALHSNKSQSQRQMALDGFRSGKFQLLVATDIAARGLDVARISHVINYDIPNTADAYIHRIGRTGRAEHSGNAITLVTTDDRDLVRDIERALGRPISVHRVDGFDYGPPTFGGTNGPGGGRTAATPKSFGSRSSGGHAGGWGAHRASRRDSASHHSN